MAATTYGLNWPNILMAAGAVAVVVCVPFSALLYVCSALTRRQKLLILNLQRQLRAAKSMNQAISTSQVQPSHLINITAQCQHSSWHTSEEPVYADVKQEDDVALTTEDVAYEEISENVKTTENVEQTSGNVMTTENVAYEQTSGNVMTTDNVAYEQTSGTTENVAYEQTSGTTKSVAYEQTSENVMTTENVEQEQTSGNVMTTENVAYEQTSGNVMTTDNVAYEQTSGTTENVAYEQTSGNVKTTENVAYGQGEVPIHDKLPDEQRTTPQEAKQEIEDEEDYI